MSIERAPHDHARWSPRCRFCAWVGPLFGSTAEAMASEVRHEEQRHPRLRAAALATRPTVLRGYDLRRGAERVAGDLDRRAVPNLAAWGEDGREGDDGRHEGEEDLFHVGQDARELAAGMGPSDPSEEGL